MTVIVGILCSDGVVIGADSAMAAGRSTTGYTIERQDGDVLKIEILSGDVITAITGATGLAQRFNETLFDTINTLRAPFIPGPINPTLAQMGLISPTMLSLHGMKGINNRIPFEMVSAVEIGTLISQATIFEFRRTQSNWQANNGWGLGALVAFVQKDNPQLIEFDGIQFHAELKGLPDPAREQDRNWRCSSMGMGSKLADAFLAHAYRLLFSNKPPTVSRAKLAATWAIDHTSRYTPGLVGGKRHLAVIEKIGDKWSASHVDMGEIEEQLVSLEKYVSEFGVAQQGAQAVAPVPELREASPNAASSPSTGAKPDAQAPR